MNQAFLLANLEQNRYEHVWVGLTGAFPWTKGFFVPSFYYLTILAEPYEIDGIRLPRLSDHNSPTVHLVCKLNDGAFC